MMSLFSFCFIVEGFDVLQRELFLADLLDLEPPILYPGGGVDMIPHTYTHIHHHLLACSSK